MTESGEWSAGGLQDKTLGGSIEFTTLNVLCVSMFGLCDIMFDSSKDL